MSNLFLFLHAKEREFFPQHAHLMNSFQSTQPINHAPNGSRMLMRESSFFVHSFFLCHLYFPAICCLFLLLLPSLIPRASFVFLVPSFSLCLFHVHSPKLCLFLFLLRRGCILARNIDTGFILHLETKKVCRRRLRKQERNLYVLFVRKRIKSCRSMKNKVLRNAKMMLIIIKT